MSRFEAEVLLSLREMLKEHSLLLRALSWEDYHEQISCPLPRSVQFEKPSQNSKKALCNNQHKNPLKSFAFQGVFCAG